MALYWLITACGVSGFQKYLLVYMLHLTETVENIEILLKLSIAFQILLVYF